MTFDRARRTSESRELGIEVGRTVFTNDYPEGWEDWLAFFGARLPRPTRHDEHESGALTFVAGAPPVVVVRLTRAGIRVGRVVGISRRADSRFVRYRWVGQVTWPHLPGRRAVHLVEQLVGTARDLRLSQYRTCFVCNRRLPPEWMDDAEICRRCARRAV